MMPAGSPVDATLSRERANEAAVPGDHAEYREELLVLLSRERHKLEIKAGELDAAIAIEAEADSRRVLTEARDEVCRAGERLRQMRMEVEHGPVNSRMFNRFSLRAGPAFRAGAAARCLLLRHTPPLAGDPPSLDPAEDCRRRQHIHQTEYARSGDRVFADSTRTPPIRIEDHPQLRASADSMLRTMYGRRSTSWEPILFSSGMGAVGTVLDYVVAEARGAGRRVLVGARSWIETRYHLENTASGAFEYVDEHDVDVLRRAVEDPGVDALFIEPIVNHFDTPVVDLDAILEGAHITGRKFLIFDTVHTPEFDPVRRYFTGGVPSGVCLVTIVSSVKFFQAGWDLSKGGVACLAWARGDHRPGESPYDRLLALRSVSGRVPSREEAELADIDTEFTLNSRLRRLDRNVRHVAQRLDVLLRAERLGCISSPWLSSHPDHRRALDTYGTGGRFVYVLLRTDRYPGDTLLHLDRLLAARAAAAGVPLTSVNSFGLAVPHTGVLTAVRAEGPVLRLSPGSTDMETCERLIDVCVNVFRDASQPAPAVSEAGMFLG